MNIDIVEQNGITIAAVKDNDSMISDEQSAVDFIARILEKTGCDRVVVDESIVPKEFFDLSTGLAGSILQKFVSYQMKIAFVGNFSIYQGKSLRDFIYESNKGKDVFFVDSEEQALEKLSSI